MNVDLELFEADISIGFLNDFIDLFYAEQFAIQKNDSFHEINFKDLASSLEKHHKTRSNQKE